MTLSQAATDYDYIRIEYYTFSNEGLVEAVTLKVEDLDGFTGGTNTGVIALGAKGAQYYYSRLGYFNSAYTTISWTTSYRAGASNTNNAYCLPKAVYGIK